MKNINQQFKHIPPGELHIWRADLDVSPGVLEQLRRSLTEDETAGVEKIVPEKDRRRRLAGRGILRHILGGYLGINPGEVPLCCNPYGKPLLDGVDTPISFNLSYSSGKALYCIGAGHSLGIDLEYIRPRRFDLLTKKYLSSLERRLVEKTSPEEKGRNFYLLWTRKEALLKARGTGINISLNKMTVVKPNQDLTKLEISGWDTATFSGWSLRNIDGGAGFTAAIAVHGKVPALVTQSWSPQQLPENNRIS